MRQQVTSRRVRRVSKLSYCAEIVRGQEMKPEAVRPRVSSVPSGSCRGGGCASRSSRRGTAGGGLPAARPGEVVSGELVARVQPDRLLPRLDGLVPTAEAAVGRADVVPGEVPV